MKTRKRTMNVAFWVVLLSTGVFLSACSDTQQEQSLTHIQSQIAVLSNEVRDSFKKSEDDRIDLYKRLDEEVRLLKKNQADSATITDQLAASLTAIDAKLDEYNARMLKLSERLNTTETALTERITSLSEQVSDIGRETIITPASSLQQPFQQPSQGLTEAPIGGPPETEPSQGTTLSPETGPSQGATLSPEASAFYHNAYTAYVNGDFDMAIAGFQKYLQEYPDTVLVDVAQFWVAESFFSIGEYETALQEYDKLITQHSDSDKIPAAFFSKADAYLQLDRQIEAISHLKYIINQFPESTAAQKAAVPRQL